MKYFFLIIALFSLLLLSAASAKDQDDFEQFQLSSFFSQEEIKKNQSLFKTLIQLKLLKKSVLKSEILSLSDQQILRLERQIEALEEWVVVYLKKAIDQQKDFAMSKRIWALIVHENHSLLVFKHDFWCIDPIFYDVLLTSKKIKAQKKLTFELKKQICAHPKR
jgi:hypothetical protein